MDPVCRMEFPADRAAITIILAGQRIHFCSAACHEQFLDDPDFFLRQVATRGRQRA